VIRTFDLGGKKLAREVMGSNEDNPCSDCGRSASA
jgi:phosphoenolpyruvate-protein kinase (PTS system EI component)